MRKGTKQLPLGKLISLPECLSVFDNCGWSGEEEKESELEMD